MDDIIKSMLEFYSSPGVTIGLIIVLLIIISFGLLFKYFKNNAFFVFFELFFEKIYDFFEEIIGREEKRWIKVYITLLFFIILFSNFFGIILELLIPIFGDPLHHSVVIPTADINFNIAMALIGLAIIIMEQFRTLGFKKAAYEYFPIFGKNFIPYERGNMPAYIDWPIFIFVKTFDIIISLFLGLLEIVGHLAKIISLSFRLFGNVTSGGLLLAMLVGAISALTVSLVGFEFPVLGPVVLYLQELLVAFIQALVFPLLIAIFIKVAKVH